MILGLAEQILMISISSWIYAWSVHRESLRTDFRCSLRFSTPKKTPLSPTPKMSYPSLNSFQSSIIRKALLTRSAVRCLSFYSLALSSSSHISSLSWAGGAPFLNTFKWSSLIWGVDQQILSIELLLTTENKSVFWEASLDLSNRNSSRELVLSLFVLDLLKSLQAVS